MRALILASILSAASFASPAFATINECPMKIDFTSADDVRAWRAVNDGVMGGLSSGGPDYEEDAMVFKGVINTNGGGFSSLRAGARPGALSDATGMRMRGIQQRRSRRNRHHHSRRKRWPVRDED